MMSDVLVILFSFLIFRDCDLMVAELIVGQPAHDWIRTTLLTPLGMSDASFTALKTDEQVAFGHDKAGQVVDFWEIAQMGAAYNLHCSAAAYAQFLLAALRPSPITNLMLTPQIQVNTSSSYDDDWPAFDWLNS